MLTINQILSQLDNDEQNMQLSVDGLNINLSHLNKPYWPSYDSQGAITKRDYLRYLTNVSPWLLPHLRDRLITLVRFPQGIHGQKFFQRHWPDNLPDFVETVKVFTEQEKEDQDFILCNNLNTLLWLGQIADLELHTMHTRISPLPDAKQISDCFTGSVKNIEKSLLNYPDYMVFDLDPYLYSGLEEVGSEPELHRKGFKETCKVAHWLKEYLDQLSLNAYLKTSGKTGMHIYVPIKRNTDYDNVRSIAKTIGKHIMTKHAQTVTMDWAVNKRTGKIFFDHNMNARSKSLASIYSPRASIQATVSTPVKWEELNEIYPLDFTVKTVPDKLKESGDLWADALENKNDLRDLLSKGFNN